MIDDTRDIIRQKILAGHRPKQNCHVTWYGFGTGNMCLACGTTIGHEDVEVECDLPAGGTILLHRKCYEIWSTEWPSCDLT